MYILKTTCSLVRLHLEKSPSGYMDLSRHTWIHVCDQQASGIHLSLPPQCWDYGRTLLVFYIGAGDLNLGPQALQSSTSWAVSPSSDPCISNIRPLVEDKPGSCSFVRFPLESIIWSPEHFDCHYFGMEPTSASRNGCSEGCPCPSSLGTLSVVPTGTSGSHTTNPIHIRALSVFPYFRKSYNANYL